tara:strand:- start:493 stop:819 length:327 start_codon:yes stop_codon:yes gene_type:complete
MMKQIIRIADVHPCIILTSMDAESEFRDITQVTRPSRAAHSNSGPDRLPQTAEIRYASGKPSPTYLETRSRVLASIMKAAERKRKGDIWVASVTFLTNLSPLLNGLTI